MNLVILGYPLGTLPAWLPIWAVPLAMVHVALFVALIVPAWVGLARARAGGPLALLLVLPILGLLMLTPIYMNRVLPYAHWGRFWGILVLIPGLNIFFLWIFAFAPWKRRYIPLDQEEYSESSKLAAARTGRAEPRLDGRSREPNSGEGTLGPGAGQSQQGTMMPGLSPRSGDPATMMPGANLSPKSGEPGTMMAGGALSPKSGEPGTMMAGGALPAARTGPSSEPPNYTLAPGGSQPLDEPVTPTPPIPARSKQPPRPDAESRAPTMPPEPPQRAAPPRQDPASRAPTMPPPEPPQRGAPPSEPSRPRLAPRTQEVGKPSAAPTEAATMRVTPPPRPGGRAWRLVGANDLAAQLDFAVSEPELLESDSGLLIGRSARANFVIEHDSISRNHARFIIERGALCLEDLDSMNGTWVDGQKLEPNVPTPLQLGGIVEIGKIRLRVTGG